LKKPQQVSAMISVATDDVMPQIATNGAPANMPIACTAIRPPGLRCRHQSASQPPTGAPARLASCTKSVAVRPDIARPMWKRSNRNFGIHESSTTATKLAHMNAPRRHSSEARSAGRRRAAAGTGPVAGPEVEWCEAAGLGSGSRR
jgi:hypothetical protein